MNVKQIAMRLASGEKATGPECLALAKAMEASRFYPIASQSSAMQNGSDTAKNGDVFLNWLSQFDITPDGVNDAIRSGSSSVCTTRAGSRRHSIAALQAFVAA
jgi:hypothetical protein